MKPVPSNAAERRDYYARIGPLHLTPLWESLHALVPREPQTPCVPALWRYWPTLEAPFRRMMDALGCNPEEFVFVDLGSGKGRVGSAPRCGRPPPTATVDP